MKLIIIILLLIEMCFAKADIEFGKLSSRNGDLWTIHTFGTISKYKVPHAFVKSNTLTIKWNIKKGRLNIKCGALCNEDDEFLIRLFDKDSLRIDFVAYGIKPNQYLSGDEYIVPANIRKDIAYMDIVPLNDEWVPEYEVICDDGYKVDQDSYNPPKIQVDNNFLFPFSVEKTIELLLPLFTTCIKQTAPNNCPPSWQDNTGSCKPGWYSN